MKFLASIEKDCTGYSFALARTIQKGTSLSRAEIDDIVREAERDGLVETIRMNLPGLDGLISVTITEKGRLWLKRRLNKGGRIFIEKV